MELDLDLAAYARVPHPYWCCGTARRTKGLDGVRLRPSGIRARRPRHTGAVALPGVWYERRGWMELDLDLDLGIRARRSRHTGAVALPGVRRLEGWMELDLDLGIRA